MLCHACHVHLRRDYPYCLHCGTLRKGAQVAEFAAPELRYAGQAYPLVKPVTTVGRTSDNDLILDDASVSRRHARITRTPDGFLLEDLDSFNGTTVGGRLLHGDRAALNDETELVFGDVAVRFAQPRSAAIGSKTMVKGAEQTMLAVGGKPPEQAATATEPLSAVPRRRSGWALKQVPGGREAEWVLSNTRTGMYLQLDERDVFIWNSLDGVNSVRDLLFLYADKFGELALPRIERTLRTFAAIQLVRGLPGQRDPQKQNLLKRAGQAVFRGLLRMELSIRGVDGLFGRMYAAFGWRFFTRTGVFLLWALVIGGLYAFFVAKAHQKLFALGGAGWVGAVIVAAVCLLALAIHESAHALAVKSYGRKVTRGGFMLMMGMPFAFVDTSDMWFGTRWSRVVVTLSGPLSTAGVAGAAALVAAYVPNPIVAGIGFHVAFALYLNTLYNLNPLMPVDGYQALSDALRMPRLREEASAYFTKGFWKDLRTGKRPGLRQWGMAAYGMLAVLGMVGFLAMGAFSWRNRLSGLTAQYLPHGYAIPVVIVGIGIIMFPIWYRLYKKVSAVVQRMLAARSRERAGLGEATTA
ncbi:FHA domain-containing protein [Hamadaea tsunoensis]|uniref:FHA domain-containing protein n=1 Tax=Hamadaea tsunoensis TaxID=53368 RepID=UPI0004264E85|nr:FHA domain-containing protein [Hamadaea tsunoensis]